MARVGILTFHYSINYGAVLQAAALFHVLRDLGHHPEVIDYVNLDSRRTAVSKPRRVAHYLWRDLIGRLLMGDLRSTRTDNFRREVLSLSTRSYRFSSELLSSPPLYDTYVVGSDQVWNLEHTRGNTTYLLDFVPDGRRRISYAASLGLDRPRKEHLEILASRIGAFDALSVREESAVDLVEQLCGVRPEQVLDPTLLLTREQWKAYGAPGQERGHYLLAYHMPGDRQIDGTMSAMCRDLAARTGLPVIHLGQDHTRALHFGEDNRFDAGPSEFLALFEGASGVVTNSFHGTAFAITMETPFVSVYRTPGASRTARSGRQISLLALAGLEARGVDVFDTTGRAERLVRDFDMDFGGARVRLSQARAKSLDFLSRAI